MLKNMTLELIAIGVTAIVAIFPAGIIAKNIGENAGRFVEKNLPGMGIYAGVFIGLVSAVIVGVSAGYYFRIVWRRMINIVGKTTQIL